MFFEKFKNLHLYLRYSYKKFPKWTQNSVELCSILDSFIKHLLFQTLMSALEIHTIVTQMLSASTMKEVLHVGAKKVSREMV